LIVRSQTNERSSVTIVLLLGLGIGANTATFTVAQPPPALRSA
jgi:hypothetical protein